MNLRTSFFVEDARYRARFQFSRRRDDGNFSCLRRLNICLNSTNRISRSWKVARCDVMCILPKDCSVLCASTTKCVRIKCLQLSESLGHIAKVTDCSTSSIRTFLTFFFYQNEIIFVVMANLLSKNLLYEYGIKGEIRIFFGYLFYLLWLG